MCQESKSSHYSACNNERLRAVKCFPYGSGVSVMADSGLNSDSRLIKLFRAMRRKQVEITHLVGTVGRLNCTFVARRSDHIGNLLQRA